MCNNLIYLTTTTTTSVDTDTIIPLTTVQRRRGKTIQNLSNNIILNNVGYYKVNASVTFTAPVAGTISVKLQKGNMDVSGITSSTTITTADTEVNTLNISGIVRVYCNENPTFLTLVNNGLAINIQNVAVNVEYLG